MQPFLYYQSAHLTDDEIISSFIVRKKEFDRVMSEIRRDKMTGSIQHYIFVGQRGSGKSTLLRRIQAELHKDLKLNARLVAVNLSEEQAGIYRLHDLWDRVCDELAEQKFQIIKPEWEQFGEDLTGYARALYETIHKALKKEKKKLVLLLDNIDRILETIKLQDNHLFREQLMNHKDVRIIGGSTRLSEHHWKYDQPFYEFFSIQRLESLTRAELTELLNFWSEKMQQPVLKEFVEKHQGRLNAVRILSDGMPRTMLHFVELLINRSDEQGYEYLRLILDRVTPVYQERLGVLSPMQQKVVLETSFFWDAVKVKELSAATRIESKTLSALLGQLVEMQIVEKIPGVGKNMLYRLKERFFNLWLIMTQGGPKQKSKVQWLTIFLENSFTKEELPAIEELNKPWYAMFTIFKTKMKPEEISTGGKGNFQDYSLQEFDDEITDTTLIVNDSEASEYSNAEMHGHRNYRAISIHNEAVKRQQYLLMEHANKGNAKAMISLAISFQKSGMVKKAERYFQMVIEKGNDTEIHRLVSLFLAAKYTKETEDYLQKAIKKGLKKALIHLGTLYYFNDRTAEQATSLILQFNQSTLKNQLSAAIEIIVSMRNGLPARAEKITALCLEITVEQNIQLLTFFIQELLVHYQKHLVWSWFETPQTGSMLKEMVRPLYFVTARQLNKPEHREDLLGQAPEILETVEGILKYIRERQAFYYGAPKEAGMPPK